MPAVLVMVQFWQLYVLNVRESSAVGKILQTGSHESIGSRKGKDIVGQLSIACQNLPRVLVSTNLQRHVLAKEIAVTSVASVKQLPVVSFGS